MSLFSDKLLEAGQQAQWNSPVYDTQGVAPHYDVEEDEDAGTISKLGHRLLGGLEGFGGDALKGIGTYLDYLDEKGRESSYIDSIRDSDGGYLKDAGDWFINNGQYLSNDATTMRQKYGSGDKYADKSLGELLTDPDYLFSSDGAIGDAMEGVGSTLPFIALNYLIPGSGLVSRGLKGASGLDSIIYGLAKTPEARKEAMKILATGEGRETLAGLARQQGLNAGDNAARRAAMWALDKGAGTAGDNALKWAYSAGPMDALTNAAGMYDDLKEQGYSYEDMVKAMGESAKEELPLDMLNMALFGTVTKGTVGNLLKGTAKPKKIIGNLLGLPIEGLSEDYQEAMQQRLNNKYTGKEYGTWDNPTPDEAAAGAQGFIGSLLPGAFGTGMGIRHSFKGQDDRATRISTAWDNIRSLNGEPPMTNSAMDMIAEANASTNAKLAADNAAAQKAAEPTAQPAFAVAEPEETQAQESASTDFDAGTYDMPTQGDAITEQVQNLKAGWADVLPQIGGVLHNQFGLDGVISSAARTPEHNAEVGGAEHSHHIDNGDGGDAVDIVLPDGTTAEQAEQVKQYFENSGAFQEVLFHDAGSGYHLHLGGLKGSLGDAGTSAGSSVDVSNLPYGNIAMAISQRTGIPAQFVWAQMAWETGDFSSGLSVEDHNYGGIKRNDGSGEYRHFDSDEDYIDYASKNLNAYKENGIGNAKTIDEFAAALHDGGYFTDDLGHYTEGLKAKLAANGLPESGSGRASSSAPSGANFLNEKPSFDISREDEAGRKMVADFIDYWQNRAGVDDADTIQGMLDANGKFRNTQENRDTVREKWGDELQQYADEHMTDEQQQAARAAQMQQQDTASARKAAQPSKKLANKDNTQPTIEVSTPNLDAAKQQTASATPQPQAITPDDITTEAPNANAQANMPAVSQPTQLSQQSATQTAQTTQAAPIEQAKAPTVQPNTEHSAPNTAQTPAMDAQQAVKQDNTLQNAQAPQTPAQAQAQQRARAAKEQRLQKELETNATIDQIERGQQLEAAAKQASVALPQGMAGALHRGQAPAIAQATELLQQKGVSLPTVEASGNTVYGKAESNNGWGSTERARFHRKLKKARAGLKKQKPKSKDERELVNSIDKAYQDIQDALEGLKNGTMSAKDAGHLIWKRHGEVASKWQNTKNKKRYLGTRGAYENAFNDATTEVHYASVEAGEDNSRSTEEPTVDPVTSKQVMQGYRDAIDETVDDYYKGELTAEESHIEMERTLEKAQGEPESRAREEDQQAFDEYVTQKENEVAEDNRQKLDGHMRERNEAKSQAKEAVANGGRGNSAQNATAPRKVEPAENASGQQMEKPSSKKSTPSRKPVKGKAGKSVTVTTDSGKELHARYRIVSASSLTTSNVYDGDTIAKNDAYPQELQPRERSGRKEMQAQTDGMAADLHPADLEASRNLNQGAPLIRSDGVVLNGNGRTMAITRAYALRNQAGKRYAQYLVEHAEDFGFTKDQMRAAVTAKGMDKPVLVRELTDDVDADTTQEIINSKIGGASMSATEQAEADAKRIKSSDFNDYDQESDGDLTKGSNDGFVSKLLRKLIGKDEANKYTDKNGQVNQDGYRRVKRAIFSRAYGDTDLIAKMAESMDDAIKNISNGLQSAAANVARLNLKMQEGNAYSYPLADTIARAVKKYNAIKEGKAEANVEAYASENETSLTGGDPEEVVKMVQALDDFHRSGKKVGVFLNHLADILDHQGSPKEDATAFDFGEASKPLTLSEAIDQAKEKTVTGGEQNLFGAPKYSIEEAKERHERTLADLKREIASAFPGAKNVREDSDHIAFTMPNGSHLEIWTTDNIELSSEEEAQAKRDHGVTGDMHIKVNGYEVTVGKDAIIALSKAGEKGTAYHEVLHIAMDILFNDREKAALAKKFGKGRGTVEERIADAFRRYKLAREHGAHVPFGKLFQRIQDFFANLADHYKELRGTMTDADVARRAFRELANGKAWERDAGEGRGARKFAGEANADENPVDNRNGQNDNEGEERARFIDRLLNEKVPENGRTSIDSDVKDGIARFGKEITPENVEDVFDSLHCVRMLRATFNDNGRMQNYANGLDYAQKMAAYMYGYARRCFENDERIKRQLALRGASVGRPEEVRNAHAEGRPGRTDEGAPRNGRQALQGTSLAKHGNVKALQELYDKLVDEAYHGKQYSVSRSDHQGGFSRAQNPRKYSIAYHGTQHEFDQFDVGKIGSGEGSQVHGWGIYFAKDRKISEGYRDLLTPQKTVQIDGKPYRIGDTALQRTVVDADGNKAPANIRYAVKALLDEGSKEKAIAALRQKSAATKLKGLAKQTREAADILQHQDVNVHQEGMLAEVSVPEDDVMLDEQKSGEEQPKSVRKALHAIVEDIQKSIDKMHEVDKVLADKSKSLDERLGFEAEDRDALLSDEKTLLNRVAAARTESDDKALGIYNWITMFEPLEDGRSGKEIYEKLSQLFGGDDRASRILNEYGVKGIKYNGHRDGDCYVVFDDKAVSIIRKLSASRAKEAHARAIEDIKAEVLKAFPGAKDVKDTEGRITFTMPNGAKVAIRIHDNMTVSGEEASRARRAHGIADGVTITVNGSAYTIGRQAVIDLSQRGEVGTVYHEALHVAMDLLFDDKTKAALMKKYGSEEKIADAYRMFMLAEARGGHVPFGKPLRAIRDFFRALASHIAPIRKACGDAWTAQKAFEDLASGKAWEPASKKSHGLSLFSHAEAAERPIDNEAARGDNEAKRENQRIEQKNQKVFASVRDAFTKEVQMLRDKGWKESSIIRAMNDENSEYRKRVVEPFARVYNQFHAKGSNKRDVVQRILGEKAFADLMQKNPKRRQEAVAEVYQALSDRMEGVMNDARKTCIELAYRLGNGQDVAGLHSWRDIEASSRKHHGGAAFTEHPAEVNHEQHHSVSRSETQDGFSDARKSDEEYLAAVDRYENAKTDEERAHALDDLRTMVQEAADAAGFHDAVPEQTVAYHTREGAAPKKTIKVYKVFTVSPDGSPTALFIGGTEKLPQGVWLDAQSAYHFQAANGKYYVPSTQNPYTKGGKTGASVEIPNEQVRQELIERGFLKPGSTAKKITALAYRPGWHAGTLPFFPQGGKKDASANYGMVHRENQVVFECELAADKNYTQEARSQEKAKTKAGKLNLKNADLQYMPENGFYFYATNPLTQSHPELGAWAISGSLKINRALSQEECDTILKKNGMEPQAWEQGKMNLQDLGYTGEQNDAARKTLAPITYDDSGNVIPLSERFNPEKHDIRYSISEEESKERAKGWLHSVGDKLAKGLHLKGEKIMLEEDAKDPSRDINLKQYIAASPSRVAEKVKTFRVLYVMADRAMNKVVSLRDGFERKLNKALALASSKDDRQDLFDLLLRGDAEGKEWTRQELIDDGVKENVADAYIQIRRQLNRAYHLVNDARRKPTPKSETVDKDRLAFLKANKFVTDLSVKDKGDGKYLVSYKEYKNYPKTYKEISADMVERFKNDPGIQVVDVKEAKTESGHAITDADGKPLYDVTTTEGPAELHKLKGYIPHFFHEYFLRVVDSDGNSRTIGSARNQREAVMQAEAWMKDHKLADGETIHVQPKVFDINKALGVSDDDFAPVMGDKDFLRVQKNLAKQNDMTLAEAKDMLDGAVRLKGRHRFFGNALHRTGAAGFETDLDWALRHYFNSASRYVAMETEFKPKAISYFERVFGAFDKDYNNNLLAKYCKDYINDINGTPSSLEQAISKALNSTWLFKKVVIPTFGDRAALTLGNGIANKISYMTLGLNMSSALLNFSQLMNSAAYIGDVRSLGQMMRKGMHRGYSLHELRILKETGVLNDIGIDSGSGYDKLRGGGTPSLGTGKIARTLTGVNRGVDFLGQKSMYFFQQADSICRRGTVLVAYEKARKEGKSHAEAIAYAKDVNNKANFQYGTQDAPNIFRRGSIVSQLALQFKKYGFKELEVMADFSPWSKKTSRKQKLMFWGMYALLCGAMGVPALDWLDEIFGEKTGFYTKDELQKAIIHLCGGNKRLAVSLMYGIPAAFNINLSSRAGMSDVIPTSLGDFAGPTISKSVRLAQDLLGGDYANALRDVNPGLYNLYAAGTGESRGKRDRLNDRYVTAWDRILRAVGFRSVDETIPTDMQRIISREKSAATKERQEAQDAYIKDPTSENKQRLKDLGIKEKDVQKEATKKNQTREERTQGTVPKKDKDKYKPLTDFMKE